MWSITRAVCGSSSHSQLPLWPCRAKRNVEGATGNAFCPDLRAFVEKAVTLLRAGVHLLIVDLLPPGPRDPQGIHKPIWDEFIDNDFSLPSDKPLTSPRTWAAPIPKHSSSRPPFIPSLRPCRCS